MKTYKDKRDINKEESEMNQKYTQKIENAPLRVVCKRVKKQEFVARRLTP